MRCSMLASIRQATSWLLQVLMVWPESTMFSLAHARRSSRAMRTKSVKSHSTRRVTRSLRRAATRRADFGPRRPETRFSAWEQTQARGTRMKFSLVRSTMRVTRSLQVRKITPAASGKISASFAPGRKRTTERKLQPRLKPRWEGKCRRQHKHNQSRIE